LITEHSRVQTENHGEAVSEAG